MLTYTYNSTYHCPTELVTCNKTGSRCTRCRGLQSFNSMDNSTLLPGNDTSLNSSGFMTYCILLGVLTLVASLLIGFTILALLMATSIPRPVRLFLTNLLLSGLLVAVSLVFMVGTSATLIAVSTHLHIPQYLCRVYVWAFGTGVVARLWSLGAFSFSILAIVRFSKKTISMWSAVVIIIILWLVPMILSLYILLPYVFEEQFVHGVACFPDSRRTIIVQARYTFLATWTIFGGLVPLAASIIVPIFCLCYIRKNIVSEGTQYRKGMAKLSLFLVVGGSINIVGQILPALLAFNSAAPGVYLSYGSIAVSLLPTPIIIMAFLKPVREETKRIITCGWLYKGANGLKNTTSAYHGSTPSMKKI